MSLKINKTNTLYFLLIVPLLVPTALYVNPVILSIVKTLKLVAFGYSVYLLINRTLQKEKLIWHSGIFFAFLFISTIVQGGDIYKCFSDVYPYFSVLVLVCSWYQKKGQEAINILIAFFIVFLFLNFLTWMIGGLYIDRTSSFGTERIVYFWGIRNSLTYCVLPIGTLIFWSLKTQEYSKMKVFLGYLSIFLNIFVAFKLVIVTTIFALMVFLAVFIINSNKYQKLSKWNKIIIVFILGTAIVVTGFGLQDGILADLLTGLGKGTTFNGRTFIWESVLSQIKGNEWILGHGTGSEKSFAINRMFTSATHSQYLYVLYDSGLIGLGLFLRMIFGQLKRLFQGMPEYGNKIIFAGMACILAAGIVEINCNNCYFYCMLAIVSCYMDKEKDILK